MCIILIFYLFSLQNVPQRPLPYCFGKGAFSNIYGIVEKSLWHLGGNTKYEIVWQKCQVTISSTKGAIQSFLNRQMYFGRNLFLRKCTVSFLHTNLLPLVALSILSVKSLEWRKSNGEDILVKPCKEKYIQEAKDYPPYQIGKLSHKHNFKALQIENVFFSGLNYRMMEITGNESKEWSNPLWMEFYLICLSVWFVLITTNGVCVACFCL